ncbi:hypothetical protein MAR_035063 [Mya arenaria]|uniref:EF-hand domain-containing protein n=1 Tax=Mya arenaria TaxID=6604 RepID=A0ABY7ELY6_MYAAR|nr:hypothetical protein MAR_035063 [Mya arenaria]
MYVNGWPIQLWEALIAHIDSKTILYALCHGGTYNVRAFSSLIGETFFSELVLHDRTGCGTVTADEFGRFIGNAIEQLHVRLDPDRNHAFDEQRRGVHKQGTVSMDRNALQKGTLGVRWERARRNESKMLITDLF